MEFKKLQNDMITAMKERDKARKDVISSLVSAAKKVAIDEGCRENIPDHLVDRAILKELKSAKEQVDTCPDERVELKAEYQFKYDVISEYAPKLMSEAEIRSIISEKYAEVAATKNKGMMMKTIMPELKGKADGALINKVITELCK